jgi:hypothetical protein
MDKRVMTMRKTFYCPRCDDEPLLVIRQKDWARAICYECGWGQTFSPRPTEDELGGMIASAVAAAKVTSHPIANDTIQEYNN